MILIITAIFAIVSVYGNKLNTELSQIKMVENTVIENLEKYILKLEDKLHFLNSEIKKFEQYQEAATPDPLGFISNPLNAFLIMKRLTSDRENIEKAMLEDSNTEFITKMTSSRDIMHFPTEDDLRDAALTVRRLQRTYNLETTDLANGIVNNINCSSKMSLDDCYDLAKILFHNDEFEYATKWFQEVLKQIEFSKSSQIDQIEILRFMIVAQENTGNATLGLEMTERLLGITPEDVQAAAQKNKFEEIIKQNLSENLSISDNPVLLDPKNPSDFTEHHREHYEKICRGEIKPTPNRLAQLHCKYVSNDFPYLKIAPFKIEELSLDPYIIKYHNVIFDEEMETLKRLAEPRFERSEIVTQGLKEFRISKTSWVSDMDSEIVKRLSERVYYMSGLNMTTAEDFQVLNYGVGGLYVPHFDFFGNRALNKYFKDGNRIQTLLFYLNDVKLGGGTAFPLLNMSVEPEKGSAILWNNLYKSGCGDFRTKHAACPVLIGTKWGANKWLHEAGQELIRPCLLKPDHPSENFYDY